MTDPRHRRGVRHSLFTILSLTVTEVLVGCRSFMAMLGARHRPDHRRA
ncbi:hypothetical protein [Arachnia propionica]